MTLEDTQAAPGRHLPQAQRLIVASREGEVAISAQAHRSHPISMTLEDAQAAPGRHLPQAHRLIPAPRESKVAISAQAHREHPHCVPLEGSCQPYSA